ncbi:MAG: hypothetical protein OER97_00720 [Gammaproteobacteria bacterium]|nr:hypothetical protein [Gammaproteobacteria bacterium]
MRFLIALIFGIATGGAAAIGLLYYNPITSQSALSPLSVSDQRQFSLNYSAVADHAIVYTNDGESRMHPHPAKVLQLWEAPIRQTETLVTMLRDARNQPVGIGIKFSSRSERTRVLNGEALVDSVWYVYLPDQGTMMIAQSENYWNFLRDIVVPAHWGSGNGWKGSWHGTITNGPGALGTASVFGGSGEFLGLESEATETLTAKAYSVELGPVAMDGQLTIELPRRNDELDISTANSVSP